MLKKTPHKRKVKTIIKRIILLFGLFLATLSLLFLGYVVFRHTGHLASPLAVMQEQFHVLTQTQDITQTIKNALNKNTITYISVQPAQESTTLVMLPDNQAIIFSNNKNVEQQIASLQLIERQLTIEGKRFHRIDFRFNDPVVTF